MIKIITAIGFLLLGIGGGLKFSEKYTEKNKFYKSLCDFNEEFYSEVVFFKKGLTVLARKTYLSSAFNNLIKSFFTHGVKNLPLPKYLNDYQKSDLYAYFSRIGKSDSQTQVEIYETFKKKFASESCLACDEQKKYSGVCKKMGLFVGLIAFIIIF